MNHQPQDSRRQAARKFVNALDELETVLKSEQSESATPVPIQPDRQPPEPPPSHQQSDPKVSEVEFGKLLDDAVQDIEQYMASDEASQNGQ